MNNIVEEIGQVDINGKPIKKALTNHLLMLQQYSSSSPIQTLHECLEIRMVMLQWIPPPPPPRPLNLVIPSLYSVYRFNHNQIFWEMVEDMTP
jgi:hypothetical protein